LKDVDTDEYVCEGPPAPRELNKPPRQSDTPDTPDTPPSLSPADRKATEQAARRYVTRELEKQGYAVEPMPLDNEGFDLRATKGADVLEVEVKGHRGRAWVIEITDAQVREYQRCREGSSCATWQLWNVQNLARGSPDGVVLTPIDDIPRDALRAQSYRFDLRRSRTGHPTAG